METKSTPITKRSLFSWIRTTHLKLQILLLFIIVVTVAARVVPLEMQKRIVNEAISLRKFDLLLTYCGIYLAAVILQGALKFTINLIQTYVGQEALAGMRRELYHHILTLPLDFFRKTQAGMVVSALITELTTSGNFVGMAIAVPVTNVLTLLAFSGYLFWLHPLLALVSLSIYPIVIFVIPMLQKRANRENKKRVDTTRALSSKIGESITGVHEIQAYGAFDIENRRFDRLADKLLKIRIVWTVYKEAVKVLNNFFTNLSPFLIFLLGGYLAMKGQLELGSLVAFLSAQEKLYTPWKELIQFYQVYQDGSVRYERTMEYFDTEPEHALRPVDREPYDLNGTIDVHDLSFFTESGVQLLENVSFSLKEGEHMAVVGFSGSGKSTLAQCIGQLYKYEGDHIRMGDKEVDRLTKKDIAQNIGYVSQAPFIFSGTIEDNVLYGCRAVMEERRSGEEEIMPSLDDTISMLQQTGIFSDVLRFGLNTVLEKDRDDDLVERILRARESFQEDFGERLSEYVEFFDEDKYLYHASITENLTFGTPRREAFDPAFLSTNDYFLEFLEKAQLTRPLLSLGEELAKQTVDILGNFPAEEAFFEESPLRPDELDDYKEIIQNRVRVKMHKLEPEDRSKLLDLALRFAPGIHKMVGMPSMLETLVMEGRALFHETIDAEDPDAYTFYERSEYIYSQSILNNILFGKTISDSAKAQERIHQSIIQLLIQEDFLERIVEIGMQYEVGTKGDRLSGGQQQKLAIARAFLKQPKVLIMDEATSGLDNTSQARIQNLLETRWKGKATLIAVVHRLDIIKNYDKVAVMRAGKIGEMGTYDDLIAKKGLLYELEFGKE